MSDEHKKLEDEHHQDSEHPEEPSDLEHKIDEHPKKEHDEKKDIHTDPHAGEGKHHESLEHKIEYKPTPFEKVGIGIGKGILGVARAAYTPIWMAGGTIVSYAIAGLGPSVLALGLTTGKYVANKTAKVKTTFKDLKEEYAKSLVMGLALYPFAQGMGALKTLGEKVVHYFATMVPTFIGVDNYMGHYLKKYHGPSDFAKDVYKRNIGTIAAEGIKHTAKESPKTTWKWAKSIYLPILATLNWTSSFSLPVKYFLSAATTNLYRQITAKKTAPKEQKENSESKHDNVLPFQQNPGQQYSPEQIKQAQNYMAQHPELMQQHQQRAA